MKLFSCCDVDGTCKPAEDKLRTGKKYSDLMTLVNPCSDLFISF